MAFLNARSVANKSFFLYDLLIQKDLDFVFLSETWQRQWELIHLTELYPLDYSFVAMPRLTGRGRDLALVFRDHLKVRLVNSDCFPSFKLQVTKINEHNPFRCILIYPPPGPASGFLSDFTELLSYYQIG